MNQDHLNTFEPLFKTHFEPLCRFALKYSRDSDEAKGIVHDVFVTLWSKFDTLDRSVNYKSYLYTAVRNRCLNAIRDRKKFVSVDALEGKAPAHTDALEVKELEIQIAEAINSLPDRCREVFESSRVEGMKYSEIAKKMNISVKTVEGQMSKAIRLLKEHLSEFITILFFLWVG